MITLIMGTVKHAKEIYAFIMWKFPFHYMCICGAYSTVFILIYCLIYWLLTYCSHLCSSFETFAVLKKWNCLLEGLLQAHVMENPDYEFTCMIYSYRELEGLYMYKF